MLVVLLACAGAPDADSLAPEVPAVQATPQVQVGPAVFRSNFAVAEQPVRAFLLDRTPVTNAQFAAFVARHPEWKADKVPTIYADEAYLSGWQGGDAVRPDSPVTWVSWHAARAYCAAQDARLPTEVEWELAAAASETSFDARKDPVFRERILAWYASGPHALPRVGLGPANLWGVQDLHGVVWEWVEDFAGALIASDARSGRQTDDATFCGGGALQAQARDDYAAYMRQAMRASLRATYTTGTLGFRCASDGGTR